MYSGKMELHKGLLDWETPDLRLGFIVNISTMTYEVQAHFGDYDECLDTCAGECGRLELLNLAD
jgi:hypothetical protein